MTARINRRELIALAGAALPFAARGQQTMPVIGFLGGAETPSETLAPFRKGLSEIGYVEGRNVAIEFRSAEGKYDRLPMLVAELIQRQVSLIYVSGSTPAALAAKTATTKIPIVFTNGGDPVDSEISQVWHDGARERQAFRSFH
jgi:putative ABC transport system substrate-binding protein